jgi:FkbM family methyltransferase
VPTDMTGRAAAPDFRFLTVMRAAMRQSHEGIAFPIELHSHEKKRRGIRRVLREIARPFEQFGRLCRRFFKANAPRIVQTEMSPPQAAQSSDLIQLTASLEALRAQQALLLRRLERQPLAMADNLLLMRMDDRNQVVPCGDFGLIIALTNSDEYEPGLSAVLRRFSNDGGMAIDVGANIGLHTVSMARLLRPGGQLLALEPRPLTFRALQATITANGLLSSVDARQIAAGARDGECLLHLHPFSGQNSPTPDPEIDNGSITVAVATLDSLVSPGTSVDLVKITAQGSEFAVIRGLTRILSESPDIVVVLEFSATRLTQAEASLAELFDYMAKQDFSAFLIDGANGSLSPFDGERAPATPSAHLAFAKRDLLQSIAAE